MELRQDFKELLELLNARGVEYLVIGGFAYSFHAKPRFTADMDVLVKPDAANAKRLLAALDEFGFASLKLTIDDFVQDGTIVQLGIEPGRVDILTSIAGVSWEDAWKNRVSGVLSGTPALFIGREDLIRNKLAAGRPQDLLDVKVLQSVDQGKTDKPRNRRSRT